MNIYCHWRHLTVDVGGYMYSRVLKHAALKSCWITTATFDLSAYPLYKALACTKYVRYMRDKWSRYAGLDDLSYWIHIGSFNSASTSRWKIAPHPFDASSLQDELVCMVLLSLRHASNSLKPSKLLATWQDTTPSYPCRDQTSGYAEAYH